MSRAIPPLPHKPSWRGAQLKTTGITLPFTLPLPYEKECTCIPYVFFAVLINLSIHL
jgi:hypothetical protein